MKKSKLLFIVYTLTSYQHDFFDELNKIYSLQVIIVNKNKYKNYKFNLPKRKYIIFLENFKNKKDKIKKILLNHKPTNIIFGGYRIKYSLFIKNYLIQSNTKFYYWLERIDKENKIKFNLLKKILIFFLKDADGIFTHGNEAKNFYSKYNKNVINLPYSIKLKKKSYKKKSSNKTNFLFVGQLIKRKGIDLIIDSLKNLKNQDLKKSVFTIVGNGKLRNKIENFSNKNLNLIYHSFQDRNELNKIYKKNDILIFPSRFDGWGVAPMEAMSHEMFLIISTNCGVTEILKSKSKNIVLNKSLSNLTQKIKFCLNNKNHIMKEGKINRKLISNSICNMDKSIKVINRVLI